MRELGPKKGAKFAPCLLRRFFAMFKPNAAPHCRAEDCQLGHTTGRIGPITALASFSASRTINLTSLVIRPLECKVT